MNNYKILIQTYIGGVKYWKFNPVSTTDKTEWETTDYQTAQDKYLELLQDNSINSLRVVDDIIQNVQVEAPFDTLLEITSYQIVNTGGVFKFGVYINDTNKEYVLVKLSQPLIDRVTAILQSQGATDIIITPWGEVSATTTQDITGTFDINKGEMRYYSNTTRTDNYVNNDYSLTI